ncbi:MAG: hypothetical protein JWM10_3473 [Myxococcaceae bacterium]|nr:hypothetical protein [Myxococcaceae bacterium]
MATVLGMTRTTLLTNLLVLAMRLCGESAEPVSAASIAPVVTTRTTR